MLITCVQIKILLLDISTGYRNNNKEKTRCFPDSLSVSGGILKPVCDLAQS